MVSRIDLSQLILEPTKRFGTSFENEYGFWIPADQVEEYSVFYKNALVATFWVSNYYEDSILLHCPMDISILQYILELQKTRSFNKDN